MENSPDNSRADTALYGIAGAAALSVLVLALLGLAGFLLDAPYIAGGSVKWVPMAPVSALCFLLLAGALLVRRSRRPWGAAAIRTAAGLVAAVCAGVLLSHLPAGRQVSAVPVWKMSPYTAGLFLLSAVGLARLTRQKAGPDPVFISVSGVLMAASSLILTGYLYGSPFFYGGTVIPVALSTGLAFLALSVALFALSPGAVKGLPFFGNSLKSVLFRNFIPLLVAAVLADGFMDSIGALAFGSRPLGHTAYALIAVAVGAWLVNRISTRIADQVALAQSAQRESMSRLETSIVESKRAEAELLESHFFIERIINSMPIRVFWKDRDLKYLGCNTMFARDAGLTDQKDLIGKDDFQLVWRDQAELYRSDDRRVLESGVPKLLTEEPQTTPEGKTIFLLTSKMPLHGAKGEIIGLLGTYMDITEHRKAQSERDALQSQFLQSQKMESVGRLAGGVAHDFNNLLTAISGYAGFLLKGLAPDDPKREDVKEILTAAERAVGLTRQLLAFSRKQILNPQVLDLNASVTGMVKMLTRLIGENIKLETALAPGPCRVRFDAGQIDQVIVNLAVNARDAMPKGGSLRLETELRTPPEEFFQRHPDMPRGSLVCFSMRDSGCGMTDAVKEHLFEPFFTTKERGKGTGLGLSTVYGVVKQSGGEVEVESAPDRGTTFRIYLPRTTAAVPEEADRKAALVLRGAGTILLVEDEESLRRLAERFLRMCGYKVISAADGAEALEAAGRQGGPLDLLMTDVVMPGMSGRELAKELERRKLVRRTLYMSGYTEDAVVDQGVLDPDIAFIYKPFTVEALSAKLREVLDGPAGKAKA